MNEANDEDKNDDDDGDGISNANSFVVELINLLSCITLEASCTLASTLTPLPCTTIGPDPIGYFILISAKDVFIKDTGGSTRVARNALVSKRVGRASRLDHWSTVIPSMI